MVAVCTAFFSKFMFKGFLPFLFIETLRRTKANRIPRQRIFIPIVKNPVFDIKIRFCKSFFPQRKIFAQIAGIKTLGYIYTSNEANSISSLELVKKGCEQAGIKLVSQSITKSDEVKQAADSIISRVDGLYLTTDNTVFSALASVIGVFNKAKKPIFSGDVTGAQQGGIFRDCENRKQILWPS